MKRFLWSMLIVGGLAAGAGAAPTEPEKSTPDHPIVPAFERFHGDPKAKPDAAAGRLLLGELNCASCHRPDGIGNELLTTKKAPVLSAVGERLRPEFLRGFIAEPHRLKPGTTMPDVLGSLSKAERERAVEALTHLLMSTAKEPLLDSFVDQGAVKRGEQLFHEVGCAVCHNSRRGDAKAINFAVPLPNLADKYTLESLATFVRDPLRVRPSGRMPSLNLNDQDAHDIAAYFLRNVGGDPNVRYAYYEGTWERLPNFGAMKPVTQGVSAGFDLGLAKRQDNWGVRFEGYFRLPNDSNYVFRLGSDDGARLTIDETMIVENDGIHPLGHKEGKTTLKAGVHRFQVDYFQGGGGAELAVELRFPGKPVWQNLASIATLTSDAKPPAEKAFQVDAKLVDEGAKLFASIGCANCHELKRDNKAIASSLKAEPLATLKSEGGCLSGTAKTPRYGLTAGQQTAARSALAWARAAAASKAPVAAKDRMLHDFAAFNCYACHQREGRGGVDPNKTVDLDDDGIPDRDPVSELLSPLFVGTTPEMGDEGRLPPRLDGVGAKLTENYLKQVLEKGSKDRPYVKTVMPSFGGGNVRHLAPLLAEIDAPIPDQLAALDEPVYRAKADGRMLVGVKGFGCVKCHQFNKQKAEGIQGIDMTIITRRVRPEWFVKYVTDPQSLRPGTRMPTIFPEGRTPLKEVQHGEPAKQVAAMWAFLSDGDKSAVPLGVGGMPIELVAEKEPVMYRNFIEGAGARGIGVGYPEHVNLALDANDLRPALIWHGAFIDAARHWNGRGQGMQPPLGDDVVRLAPGVNFASLKDAAEPWPTAKAKELGYRFRGYFFETNRRPQFLYEVDGMEIRDVYEPVKTAAQPGLRRSVLVTADRTKAGIWFRAAVGKEIKPLDDGWYQVDGLLRVRVKADAGGTKATVRSGAQGQELIVRWDWVVGSNTLRQEFAW
jgi:mono/diheme cytochrome c family protein